MRTPVNDRFIVLSPYETPDAYLALATHHAGAYPILHLGRDPHQARKQLTILTNANEEFGVAYSVPLPDVELPDTVTMVLAPWGMTIATAPDAKHVWQVTSVDQALAAIDGGATAIALKGNDAAGYVGRESTFILFQHLVDSTRARDVEVYIQGGVGVHTAAAYLGLGARAVILDSQVALFPEAHANDRLRRLLATLNDHETTVLHGVRVLSWPTMPHLDDNPSIEKIDAMIGGLDPDTDLIPLGQDFTLSGDYVRRYHHLDALIDAMAQALTGHIRQARHTPAIRRDNDLAHELGTAYPIIQQAEDAPAFAIADSASLLDQHLNDGDTRFIFGGTESDNTSGALSSTVLWEKQLVRLLALDDVDSFRIIFSGGIRDEISCAFVSIMAASLAARGAMVGIQLDTAHLLATVENSGSIPELLESVVDAATDLLSTIKEPSWSEVYPSARTDTPVGFRPQDKPIAIIGMAGFFPQANNVEEYWRNTLCGRDCITEVPKARWDPDVFYNPDTMNTDFVASKWGGFISPQEFNPLDFGIAPNTVASIEPAHLLSLLVAVDALKDAGIDYTTTDLSTTSVIFATEASGELSHTYASRVGLIALSGGNLPPEVDSELPNLTADSLSGVSPNILVGRIANRLNCGGRNFTLNAACASTLAAVDMACFELWSDRADMVICGATDLHNSITDYSLFSATHALSRQGHCATFDQSGDGLALGEGVGAIILKRLADAERDQDHIYAVIRGVDGASDGRCLGLTAPNKQGQMTAMERAYRSAGISPAQISLVEAHGTGTAVGDRTELAAISQIFLEAGALPGQVWIGSGKTQIGHTKCAAGLAAIIRVALSLQYRVVPPTLHLTKPLPVYVEGRSPVSFNASDEATLWLDDKRIAGLSAFGFGGTNFHMIMENYGPNEAQDLTMTAWEHELYLVRGTTLAEAKKTLAKVSRLYETNRKVPEKNVAHTLACASEAPVQICIVARDWEDLNAKIDSALQGRSDPDIMYRSERGGKVAFLFPGLGSQHVNMGRGLFVMFPKLCDQLRAHPQYASILLPKTVFTPEGKAAQACQMDDPFNAVPLLGIVDTAIADLLVRYGVTPDTVAGHSDGELARLAFTGEIPREDLVSRAQDMAAGPPPVGADARFADTIRAMYTDGVRVFIEAGPGRALTTAVKTTLGAGVTAIAVEDSSIHDLHSFLRALGAYAATGRDLDVTALFAGRETRMIDLDHPESCEPRNPTWMVDAILSVPFKEWREAGWEHPGMKQLRFSITDPATSEPEEPTGPPTNPAPTALLGQAEKMNVDQIVLSYFYNMQMILGDQRDVVLTHLGNGI